MTESMQNNLLDVPNIKKREKKIMLELSNNKRWEVFSKHQADKLLRNNMTL